MINRLVGAATLFTASAIFIAGAPQLRATPVATLGNEAALMTAADCGDKDMKKDPAAAAKAPAKAKDGSCGKGSCGAKDMKGKKGKKDGSCGKAKKDAPPAADKQ